MNIMGLYETLADVYDDVFPVNPMTLSFIGAPSRSGARLLDLGCATGGHALALAEAGWTAV
ncbi:MAG: SAM-dependent methyltransferase, partial [Spirochaetales bacterium]